MVEAADARAALAAAERTLPDLVLQDLILPDMDGFELLRRLRALPGGTELPILALSGFLSRLEEAQTDQEGFTALLVKPIEPSRLVDAIRVYLPQRPALATSRGEGRRLLVVDDDPVQLKLTRIHFSQLGFDVSAAGGASDALIAARATRPDVILSDVFMPGADGFDLCLEIRRDPTPGERAGGARSRGSTGRRPTRIWLVVWARVRWCCGRPTSGMWLPPSWRRSRRAPRRRQSSQAITSP